MAWRARNGLGMWGLPKARHTPLDDLPPGRKQETLCNADLDWLTVELRRVKGHDEYAAACAACVGVACRQPGGQSARSGGICTARHIISELVTAWSAYVEGRFEDMLSYRLRLKCTLAFHLTTLVCMIDHEWSATLSRCNGQKSSRHIVAIMPAQPITT